MRLTAALLGLVWVYGVCRSSAQSEVKELKCIVGDAVSLPAAVKKNGLFLKNGSQIARVVRYVPYLTVTGRLQWNSSTGVLSITQLKKEDSGEYVVQNMDKHEVLVSVYQLSVYDPVPRPQVSSRNKMKPNCSVLCSVENGREVTLSWHREGQTLSHTSSPNFSSPLSLPLEIEENSAPYGCMAANPASNETVTVRPEEHCFDPVPRPQMSSRNKMKPSCSVLCSVENGREVTLSWHREGQTLSHTSSPNFSSPLSLPLEIETNSAPYSCVATNPVSNKTVIVRPEEHCFDRDIRSLLVAGIEAFIGILFIILMGTYVCLLIRSNTPGS
ncbi:hypothetical protein ANANG_G00112590 [Anguilla anguilla]|uniref:Ig-like domain-containing protein n=1 Tax=Anguilla anguilla TaxID=7936 RepID=A0A9D3MNK4_ANGAN|nr:hypothetical protein ANANG_G00112590 [Anguilla anguilla]